MSIKKITLVCQTTQHIILRSRDIRALLYRIKELLYQKVAIKKTYLLISTFICCMLAQAPILIVDTPVLDKQLITESQISKNDSTLIRNAIIPLFLSDDSEIASQQLANLIQKTAIYRVQVFDHDLNLLGEALNVSAEIESTQLIHETIDIKFQNELAGTALIEIQPATLESKPFLGVGLAFVKSLFITFIALLFLLLNKLRHHFISLKQSSKKMEEAILEPVNSTKTSVNAGESMLLYVYLTPEKKLLDDNDALSQALLSFGQKLEDHIHVYGGRILSLSKDKIVCRMPTTSNRISRLNVQQAITFCWGIARPQIFQYKDKSYRLNIVSILHKTSTAARTGNLTRAMNDLAEDIESKIKLNEQGAYLTKQFLSSQNFSDFEHKTSSFHPDLNQIIRVRKSLDELWKKQEAMIGKHE